MSEELEESPTQGPALGFTLPSRSGELVSSGRGQVGLSILSFFQNQFALASRWLEPCSPLYPPPVKLLSGCLFSNICQMLILCGSHLHQTIHHFTIFPLCLWIVASFSLPSALPILSALVILRRAEAARRDTSSD